MDFFHSIIVKIDSIIWGPVMIFLLLGTGIYLTIVLKGLQFRALFYAFKLIFVKEENAKGDVSNFAVLMTALAATVGIGNIVGVATAISLGGPGAIFWMWLTGLVGMATKYSEAILAVKYREKGKNGYKGGPMYYLLKGAKMPFLAFVFALFTVFASFGIGNMAQINSLSCALESQFNMPVEITGIIALVITAFVIIGGIKSIAKVTSFLIPFMILIYLGSSLYIIISNISEVKNAFLLIFEYAFNPAPAAGGFIGASIAASIRYGIARGIFSNESGLGSAPIAAAAAKTNDPVKQALVSMTQTFIDTLIVCTMTALIILMAPVWQTGVNPGELTMKSFEYFLGGRGSMIITIATVLFGYSTVLGWSYYGERAFEYMFGENSTKIYKIIFILIIYVGAVSQLKIVWDFSDLANGLMAIPNLIGLLILSKIVVNETNRHFNNR